MSPKRFVLWKVPNACRILATILSMAMIISLCGCGDSAFEGVSDDDSFEAQMEEAKIALDDSDFSRAATILEAMEAEYPDNQDVKQYLSNAYAGLAGLDTYNLLETMDRLNDAGQSGSIDMIGCVLGDANGLMSATDVTIKLDLLDDAIVYIDQTLSKDDCVVQRGILAKSRLVLLIAAMIIDQLGLEEVTMTEAGIQTHYADQDPNFDGIFNTDIQQKMTEDIQAIEDAISVITDLTGSDNDLYEDFDIFMNDLDPDGNRIIDQAEIEAYLLSIIDG